MMNIDLPFAIVPTVVVLRSFAVIYLIMLSFGREIEF
jgi:hypothetical protein